jgi:hypothetical protein
MALPAITTNYVYPLIRNNPTNDEGDPKSALDFAADGGGKSFMAYRDLKLGADVSKAASYAFERVGSAYASVAKELSGMFGSAANALSIPRFFEVTNNAYKAVRNWSVAATGPLANTYRAMIQKIHDIFEAIATYGFIACWLTRNPFYANVVAAPDLVTNITDFGMASQDWAKAGEELDDAHTKVSAPDFVNRTRMYAEKMRHSLLLMIKSVCSVVTGVFGLMAIAAIGPVLHPVAGVVFGLTGTMAAIGAYFYKETATFKLPDYTKAPPQTAG